MLPAGDVGASPSPLAVVASDADLSRLEQAARLFAAAPAMSGTVELLLVSTDKAVAHVVDAHSGASLHTLKDCRPTPNGLVASTSVVMTAESTRSFVNIWSWRKEQPRYRCQTPERVTCLVCSADGAHCVGGGVSGKLYLWQVATGRLLLSWDAHFKPATALHFVLGDGFLLSAGEDAILLVWNVAGLLHAAHARAPAPSPLRTWTEHVLPISAIAVAPCGQHDLIGTASHDQTVRLWRLSDDSRKGSLFCEDLCVSQSRPPDLWVMAAIARSPCSLTQGSAGRISPPQARRAQLPRHPPAGDVRVRGGRGGRRARGAVAARGARRQRRAGRRLQVARAPHRLRARGSEPHTRRPTRTPSQCVRCAARTAH